MADLVEPHATTSLWRPAGADASEDRVATLDQVLAVGGVQPATEDQVAQTRAEGYDTTQNKVTSIQLVKARGQPNVQVFVNGVVRARKDGTKVVLTANDFRGSFVDKRSNFRLYSPLAITFRIEDGARVLPKCEVEVQQQFVSYEQPVRLEPQFVSSADLLSHRVGDATASVVFTPFPVVTRPSLVVRMEDKRRQYAYDFRTTKSLVSGSIEGLGLAISALPGEWGGTAGSEGASKLIGWWNFLTGASLMKQIGTLGLAAMVSVGLNPLLGKTIVKVAELGTARLPQALETVFKEWLLTAKERPPVQTLKLTLPELAKCLRSLSVLVPMDTQSAKALMEEENMLTEQIVFTWLLTGDAYLTQAKSVLEKFTGTGGKYGATNKIDLSDLDLDTKKNAGVSHTTKIKIEELSDEDANGCRSGKPLEFTIESDYSQQVTVLGMAASNLVHDIDDLVDAIRTFKGAVEKILSSSSTFKNTLSFVWRALKNTYLFFKRLLTTTPAVNNDLNAAMDGAMISYFQTINGNIDRKLLANFVTPDSPAQKLKNVLNTAIKGVRVKFEGSIQPSLLCYNRILPHRLDRVKMLFASGDNMNWRLVGTSDLQTKDFAVRENSKLSDAVKLNSVSLRTQRLALSNLVDEWEQDGATRMVLHQCFTLSQEAQNQLRDVSELQGVDMTSLLSLGVLDSVPMDLVEYARTTFLSEEDQLRANLVNPGNSARVLEKLGFDSSPFTRIAIKLLGVFWTQELIRMHKNKDLQSGVMANALRLAAARLTQSSSLVKRHTAKVSDSDPLLKATLAGRDARIALVLFFGGEVGLDDKSRLVTAANTMQTTAAVALRLLAKATNALTQLPFEPLQSLFANPCMAIHAHRRVRDAMISVQGMSPQTTELVLAAVAASYGSSQLLTANADDERIRGCGDYFVRSNVPCPIRGCPGETRDTVHRLIRHRLASLRIEFPIKGALGTDDIRTIETERLVDLFVGLSTDDAAGDGAEDSAITRTFLVPNAFGSFFSDANDIMFGSVPVFVHDLLKAISHIKTNLISTSNSEATAFTYLLDPQYPLCQGPTPGELPVSVVRDSPRRDASAPRGRLVSFVASLVRPFERDAGDQPAVNPPDCKGSAEQFRNASSGSARVFESVATTAWNAERVAQVLYTAVGTSAMPPDNGSVSVGLRLFALGMQQDAIDVPADDPVIASVTNAVKEAQDALHKIVTAHVQTIYFWLDPELPLREGTEDLQRRRAALKEFIDNSNTVVDDAFAEAWVEKRVEYQDLALETVDALEGEEVPTREGVLDETRGVDHAVKLRIFPQTLEKQRRDYQQRRRSAEAARANYRETESTRRANVALRARSSMIGGCVLGFALANSTLSSVGLVPTFTIDTFDARGKQEVDQRLDDLQTAFGAIKTDPDTGARPALRLSEAIIIMAACLNLL